MNCDYEDWRKLTHSELLRSYEIACSLSYVCAVETDTRSGFIMAFDRLLAELVLMILQEVDNPFDLHALISASPGCLRLFRPRSQVFLTRILGRGLLPGVQSYALKASDGSVLSSNFLRCS